MLIDILIPENGKDLYCLICWVAVVALGVLFPVGYRWLFRTDPGKPKDTNQAKGMVMFLDVLCYSLALGFLCQAVFPSFW